ISPRLAISTFSNISTGARLLDQHQRGAVLDRLGIADEHLGELSGARRANLVHHLHRLDDQQRLALADGIADADERRIAGLRGQRADQLGIGRSQRSPTPQPAAKLHCAVSPGCASIRLAIASNASSYPCGPRPQITPLAAKLT